MYRIVGDDVDDVMQAAYVRAFRGWAQFEGRAAPSTWLHSIAVRAAIDHLRVGRRALAVQRRAAVADPSVDVAGAATDAVDLARALQLLPVDQRVVLLLIDGQGFTHEEAATTLAVPVGTVGSRLSRARQAMRVALEGGST